LKKSYKVTIVTCIVILIVSSLSGFSYGQGEIDYYSELLKESKGRVCENGVKCYITLKNNKEGNLYNKTQKDNKEDLSKGLKYSISDSKVKTSTVYDESIESISLKISKNLGFTDKIASHRSIFKGDNNFYRMEYDDSSIKGYVEAASNAQGIQITIDLEEVTNCISVDSLKERVSSALDKLCREESYTLDKNLCFYDYVKVQLNEVDAANLNQSCIAILKKHKASNVHTINISNGFGTTAYTGGKNTVKNLGKAIDFNYAVVTYSSGSYLIMGRPILTINY